MLSLYRLTRFAFFSFVLPSFVSLKTSEALVTKDASQGLDWVPFDREQFDGNTTLDENGDVQLFWKTGNEYSKYGIASRSQGYLALGFSETGAMTGADIALGYKDSDGVFVLENRYAEGFMTPQLSNDQNNNIRLQEGYQEDGVTAFVFEKKNKADCLLNQVDVTKDSWQWFIYAFSDENSFAIHAPGKNGNKYVKLGTTQSISVSGSKNISNSKEFTVAQPEITIPTNETSYCYTLHKLPAGKKNFILSERTNSSSNLLHHMVVYSCYDLPENVKETVGAEPVCDLNFSNPCHGFVAQGPLGARTFEPGFGKPFGSDSFEYVMLEVHYNNPEGIEGEKDSTGYTFSYTDEQVETEIGTLTLGDVQISGWSLEPGKEIVARTTVCTPECTKLWPPDGIKAVSVVFHMHQRGRNQRVQIIRDGKEIQELSSIRSFEYDYQYSKNLEEIQLLLEIV